jgi:hypothetical protein
MMKLKNNYQLIKKNKLESTGLTRILMTRVMRLRQSHRKQTKINHKI